MATRSREKAAARRENADKRPRATAKYVRIAPRKVKIVVDLIRGQERQGGGGDPAVYAQGSHRACHEGAQVRRCERGEQP